MCAMGGDGNSGKRDRQTKIGMAGKLAIVLVACAILAIPWIAWRNDTVDASAQAYDVAHAKKLAEPFLPKYGLKSLRDGKVDREEGGLVFNGTGIDAAGKPKRVMLHFRSTKRDGKIAVGISRIAIDGNEVFRSLHH